MNDNAAQTFLDEITFMKKFLPKCSRRICQEFSDIEEILMQARTGKG